MDKVQYIGPVMALRGQTALMRKTTVGELHYEPHARFPSCVVDKDKCLVQWDWPEGQKFTPKDEPIDAPPECFGWHEVDPAHWRMCHTISELQAI